MTPEEVADKVDDIDRASDDPEVAHSMEDGLWADVLKAIAAGTAVNPAECASVALRTADLRFARWYA